MRLGAGVQLASVLVDRAKDRMKSTGEDEQKQAIKAIDTVQLYDAVVKIVEYNGESQVRLQKLTACAVEVSDLEEKSKDPGQKSPKKSSVHRYERMNGL